MTHLLKVGSRIINTGGKYLTLTFDQQDQHLSLETHDQVRPLESNQVRLTVWEGRCRSKSATTQK